MACKSIGCIQEISTHFVSDNLPLRRHGTEGTSNEEATLYLPYEYPDHHIS